MAAEVGSAPVNGYHGASYGAADGHSNQANVSSASPAAPASTATSSATQQQQQSSLSKEEVAWYFVESYYNTMSRSPEKLHLFFNKRSQLVSGVEEVKSSIAVGQKAIKERIAELDFQDCKVRVTNVDTQGSDTNIVIQVIGEMSNKSQPRRKFVQTFVLAAQTNGYFVLNDIFRYIAEDESDDEAEAEAVQQSVEETEGTQEPVPTAADSGYSAEKETMRGEAEVKEVDKKLEEVKHEEESESAASASAVNGTPATAEADVAETEEAPAAATATPESKPSVVENTVAKDDIEQPEKPQDPSPTPATETAAPAAATPSAPPKAAVPLSWAQRAAGPQAAKAAVPAARQAPAASTSTQAKPSASAPAAQPAPAASSTPAREASPDSNKDGSTGGWQTAGADHSRKQSRAHNANSPATGQDGRVRAFVKNVTEDVDADALKQVLSRYGEIVYFDVARQKKAAFVEYKTLAGFQAAVSANPHRIGSEDIWVEERRVSNTSYNARGGARGGSRGGSFDGRAGSQGRGDYKGTGSSRGNFSARGGRGGSGNVTPKGRGGQGA
ncbi:hypothetical protein, variant [Verruconis gallopava]|uniref:NTF2 domain-containing protein n=1 Tax=Verruconis gallopava TaxID=253628 RepID=A0A0D2ATX2_9PEZI|nr:uncharacterized protein PV09_06024 [Verruconis gallopava]XP_016212439.1 hypothetical protein, variant [Verruconis gallopava]KIW02569.1 hypothetical protein PV09_06024 [Verruconis gallopava]KIW02570.1 hypothetical protein, variant [Verruconis gallopava]